MSLNIHQIKNEEGACSYFVQRPFGNYIIFSDGVSPLHVDFLQSKGGVYKQFVEDAEVVNINQKNLFVKFGAAAVASCPVDGCSEEIPIEFWGQGFSDPTLRFRNLGGVQSIILKQGEKKVAFLGKSYFYKDSKDVLVNGELKTEEVFNALEKEGVSVVLFSAYSWDHLVEL